MKRAPLRFWFDSYSHSKNVYRHSGLGALDQHGEEIDEDMGAYDALMAVA